MTYLDEKTMLSFVRDYEKQTSPSKVTELAYRILAQLLWDGAEEVISSSHKEDEKNTLFEGKGKPEDLTDDIYAFAQEEDMIEYAMDTEELMTQLQRVYCDKKGIPYPDDPREEEECPSKLEGGLEN